MFSAYLSCVFHFNLTFFNLRINKSSNDDILYILLLTEQEGDLLQIPKSHGYVNNKRNQEQSRTKRQEEKR
jgi:hypothetical protein